MNTMISLTQICPTLGQANAVAATLEITSTEVYITKFDNALAEAAESLMAARGNQILGRSDFAEHFHCSSPAANLAGVSGRQAMREPYRFHGRVADIDLRCGF